jgi:hypothetical protein
MSTKPEALSISPLTIYSTPFRAPLRPRSLLASLGVHGIIVFLLGAVSSHAPSPIVEPERFKPEDHKIVYYDFRKKIPEVRPDRRILEAPKPRATELSKQTIVAKTPQPQSKRQVILLPAPKVHLEEDLVARNTIARLRTSLPALPAPPPVPPRDLPRPEVTQGIKVPEPVASTELKDLKMAPEKTPEVLRPPKTMRAFVPPPPSPRTPRLPIPTAILDAPAPVMGAPPMQSSLSPGAGVPVFSAASAPPPIAPPAAVARDGNAQEDVAVVSLRPSEKANNVLPTGDRPGEFSKAPGLGVPSPSPDGKGLIIPNLEIREEGVKPVKPPVVAPVMRTVVYSELMRNIPISTLSAPLRPGVRNIPMNLEPRFQQRIVYTMVVPIENLPIYGGDWILWFAERQPDPTTTPLMRAPLPSRKLELVDPTPVAQRTSQRIQVAGVLEKDGKLSGLLLLTQASPAVEQAVMRDVSSWEFKPATRNGTPVGVDIVIEIPFSLPMPRAGN